MRGLKQKKTLMLTLVKLIACRLFLAILLITAIASTGITQDTTETYLRPYKDTLQHQLADSSRIIRLRKMGSYYLSISRGIKKHLDSSLSYLNQACNLARTTAATYYIAQTDYALAKYYFQVKRYDTAKIIFRNAVSTWNSIHALNEVDEAWAWAAYYVARTEKMADFIIEAAQHTLPYYEKKKDSIRLIFSLGVIAEMHFKKGELDIAEKKTEAVIEKCKAAKYNYIHHYYYQLSWITRYKGNYAKTMRMTQMAVETLVLPRDSFYAKKYYMDLAELYSNAGQLDKFEEFKIKSVSYSIGIGSPFLKAKSRLVLTHLRDGDRNAFIAELHALLEKYKPIDVNDQYIATLELAYAYLIVKKYEKAEAYFLKVMEYEKHHADPDNEETIFRNYYVARMYTEWKKFNKAQPYLDAILAMPQGHYPLGLKREAHYMYYQVDSANGRYLSAINHLQEYKKLFDKITSETSSWQFQELTTRFETNQKEAQLKQMTDSNLLQQTRLRILNDSIMADTRQRQLEALKREIAEAERNKDLRLLHAENLLAQARLVALSDSISNTEKLRRFALVQDSLLVTQKEQNIKLLTSNAALQQKKLSAAQLQRDFILLAIGVLGLIIATLVYFYLNKQKTSRKIQQQNLTLQQLVQEKEWLLKEVHHRVKNNLHTVVSLLESQSAYLTDDALAAVVNSQNRVYTMSLIHQKLYQSGDMSTVDMAVYLPELMDYLAESYDPGNKIRFEYNIAKVQLDGSCAVPVGLIVNEAVTNSMKYAFGKTANPTLQLSLSEPRDNRMTLMISDNGIGISDQQIMESTGSLGLKLIRGLAQDIGGQAEIFNDQGTRIVITIPAKHITGFSFPGLSDIAGSN